VTGDVAFAVLSRASQESNVKLRDVADHLVQTGYILTTR
jgi:ANTAR domain-containing protein